MAGGLQRTPSRTEQRRAISCERSREEMIGAMMHEAASATKPKKHKSADVTTIVDSRFTQIRGELDGLVQQQMESLKADFGARLTDIEHEAANLKTSTTQQIDIGERAAERTNEHVNNEIIEMNRKLDGVNLRLSNMEAQLTELSPAVNQYRTEGVQAMQNLTTLTGVIRTNITDLRQADDQRRHELRALRDEHTAETEARRLAEANLSTRIDSFGLLVTQAIANASAEERALLEQLQTQNRNTEQLVARLHRRMDDAERPKPG